MEGIHTQHRLRCAVRFPRFSGGFVTWSNGPGKEPVMARPSKFPAEFRARGVQLYRDSEGRTIGEVARELGVGAETFRKWVRQDEADRGERDEKPTSVERAELARLRRENAELRRTNEIPAWATVARDTGAGRRACTHCAGGAVQGLRPGFEEP